MNKFDEIRFQLEESAEIKRQMIEACADSIVNATAAITNSLKNGGRIYFCGNGGSAADSQHIATEFVIRLDSELDRDAIPAIALTTDTSTLTAAANDYGFEKIFSRQIEALGRTGDVLVSISTSGNSNNIVSAVKQAKMNKMKTIGLLGGNGGKLKNLVDIPIIVPTSSTARIQEGHITIGHILCYIVERELYSE